MSKIPKVSGNQMVRYLQRQGFVITRRKGSHVTLRNGGMFTTVPARNKLLKVGIQHGILSDVNITREKFVEDHKNKLVA